MRLTRKYRVRPNSEKLLPGSDTASDRERIPAPRLRACALDGGCASSGKTLVLGSSLRRPCRFPPDADSRELEGACCQRVEPRDSIPMGPVGERLANLGQGRSKHVIARCEQRLELWHPETSEPVGIRYG